MKQRMGTVKAFIVLVVLISVAAVTPAANWPQWRGPDGSGISNEKNLPATWTPTTNIKWKAAFFQHFQNFLAN